MQLTDALNLSDYELLARTIMAEAGNQRDQDMFAVGNVIMNRLRQGGGTLKNVILSPAQFSPWNTTTLPDGSLLYAAGKDQGRDMGAIKPSAKAYEIADLLLSGEVRDITGGATHFFNPKISSPKWAEGMSNKTKIGSHVYGRAGDFPSGLPSAGKPLSAIPEVGAGSLLKERNMVMDPNAPKRTGLLGMFDRMRQADPETGLTGFERFGAALDPLLMPEQRMGEQIRARGAQRMATQSRNRTIDTLKKRAQAGDTLAAMVLQGLESGAYDAKTAMSLYMGKMLEAEKDTRTSQIKNYEYWISLGKSPAEAEALVKSGQTINVDKGEDKFAVMDAQILSDTYAVGLSATRNLGRIGRLEELLSNVPTGAMASIQQLAGNFGIKTQGLDDIQAAQALINALVPEQRPAGSGPMSDADLELFKQSLPRIINSPNGNQIIINTLRGIAQYDAEGARIVQKYRGGEIDKVTAFQMLQERADPFAAFKSSGQTSQSTGTQTAGGNERVNP